MNRFSLVALMAVLSFTLLSCQKEAGQVQYHKWTVSTPILTKGTENSFDNVAVKDPSIVFYQGKYHLFYTGKSSKSIDGKARYDLDTGYVSAATLEGLKGAKRYNLRDIVGEIVIAPQVFFFEPQQLWYLVGHTKVSGKPNLAPVYLSNKNIDNVYGWSKLNFLKTGKSNDEFWIDFWVICDDENAHLFYSNQRRTVLRMQCPIETFPEGFAQAREQVALTMRGQDEYGPWEIFEAQHVYHVKDTDEYLAVLECGYYETGKNWHGDARRRFMIGMVADKLEGAWHRIEKGPQEYLAQAEGMFDAHGNKSSYTQVSHPELIRCGYDQKLEIENYKLQMIFQSFDGSKTPDNYNYNDLPWELAVMRNF
jgi:hypothetical protein